MGNRGSQVPVFLRSAVIPRLHFPRTRNIAALMLISLECVLPASAGTTVWVDFTSDFHGGIADPNNPDTIADWIHELDQATSDAGVTAFSSAERATIEGNILTDLGLIYADYDVTFVTTDPGGENYDAIYMARYYDTISNFNYGSATVDIGNRYYNHYTGGYSVGPGNPSNVARVTTRNFDTFIEGGDSRATQITEISAALAGTAAHELGHTFGLRHYGVYSDSGITPANYDDTGGLQNQYILATGSTGITETQRETLRSISPFSQVLLDIAGGVRPIFGSEDNVSLVAGSITSDFWEDTGGDAGDTIGTARALSSALGPTSGMDISFVEADLDGSSDVDVYSFTTNIATTLLAQVFSEQLSYGSSEGDFVLELLDGSGSLLTSSDDIAWDDNDYHDPGSPEEEEMDPFILNWAISAGDYYLRVSPATSDIDKSIESGDNYWLVSATLPAIIPEPSSLVLASFGLVGLALFGWRRNSRKPRS